MSSREEARKAVAQAIEEGKQQIMELGDWFWRNPESGFKEYKTSRHAVEFLRELGISVTEGLAVTGFRGELDTGRPGPVFALLGELDALVMPGHPECDKETKAVHACGHNSSITSLLGAAYGLVKANASDELCGKILFIGTPAEEGIEMDFRQKLMREGKIGSISGKSQLIREGVFDDVDMAYMSHLSTGAGFNYNGHNGSLNKKITFKGRSCHAASPQNGINALNASSLAQHAIGLFRESLGYSSFVRIHGIITEGGTAVNIIPNTVKMEFMLRAPTLEEIISINDRFDKIVMHAAKAAECEAVIETVHGFMPGNENADLTDVFAGVVSYLKPGIHVTEDDFSRGSTDMCDVEMVIPAMHAYIPGGGGRGHGTDYCIQDPYSAYVVNSKVMALMAVELLYGNAEKGRKIAEAKKGLKPVSEYVKLVNALTKTLDTEELIPY